MLYKDLLENTLWFYSGKTLLEALEWKYESLVIDSHALQYRGIEIVDMHRILGDIVAKVIGCSQLHASSDATSRHPNRKALGMMIPTIVLFAQTSLAVHGSTKLPPPNHQRGIQ
jgi:hypothetical protein